jgi:hypothetical protein
MSPAPLNISTAIARNTVLNLQGLADPPHGKQNADQLLELIARMGFVQIDTINTVERAHHQILFARNQTYQREHLADLLERRGDLFEQWTHDASIIPTQWFPYWKHRFARAEEKFGKAARWKKILAAKDDPIAKVHERIAQDGPIASRHIEKQKDPKQESWWGWSPQKAALSYLWHTGKITIARRENFQRVFDLTDRVIAPEHFEQDRSHDEFVDWACRTALDRLGFGTAGDIARFWGALSPKEAAAWLEKASTKDAIPLSIGDDGAASSAQAYARPDIEEVIAGLSPAPKRVRFISPFDPVIRDRKRMEKLFDFDYRIEIFVPEKKRQYGYYVFPILEGDKFIGRIDLKAFRKEDRLAVLGLWLEDKVKMSGARRNRIEAELNRLRRFLNLERVDPGI